MSQNWDHGAGETPLRRLFVFNGGFLFQPRLRQILRAAGFRVCIGWPGPGDCVGVWGQSPTARRGIQVAQRTGATLVRIEDAFVRSLHPGRSGDPPLGLLIDTAGLHFDGATTSDLETVLATHPLDDTRLLNRARNAITWMKSSHLCKYSAFDPEIPVPEPGYVLVVDQTEGDASVTASNANRARFVEMLVRAQEDHPGARAVIKTHPETIAGHRGGYFRDSDLSHRVSFVSDAVSPWALLEGAVAVYTVSSQLGFEAIMAGHKPVVFGQPFYAGWGLTQDEDPVPRRTRRLTRAQLFAAAMILAPVWYDPYRKQRTELEVVLATMQARATAWRQDRHGWVAQGMRLWKRRPMQCMFGREKRMIFQDDANIATTQAQHLGRRHMVWASAAPPDTQAVRVEDGFLRSRGLGAKLVPPLSLVLDDLGIYYDPHHTSRLEQLIMASPNLPDGAIERARQLVRQLVQQRITKYNLGGSSQALPAGHRILVPGQVEDDASIRMGCGEVTTNAGLLAATRDANPQAAILYKPHPDVLAGLRPGAVENAEQWADCVVSDTDITHLLDVADEVWTLTSLTGFEALLRGCRVVTLGVPFYAGWGLTRDLGPVPERRQRIYGVTPERLAHAALIDYPRYYDPVTGHACPPEVVLDRLSHGPLPRRGAVNRGLSKIQGMLASHATIWRD